MTSIIASSVTKVSGVIPNVPGPGYTHTMASGLIVGIVALGLSVFASAAAVLNLYERWKYRRPRIRIVDAYLGIERDPLDPSRLAIGPGLAHVRIRGANNTLDFNGCGCSYSLGRGWASFAVGVGEEQSINPRDLRTLPFAFEVPARRWRKCEVPFSRVILDWSEAEAIPDFYFITITFETPEESLQAFVKFRPSKDEKRYVLSSRGIPWELRWRRWRGRWKRIWRFVLRRPAGRLEYGFSIVEPVTIIKRSGETVETSVTIRSPASETSDG